MAVGKVKSVMMSC